MAPGFLAVFSEPGNRVSHEEFQDWYNNEHIPLRLNHLPCFLTGARFSASDSKTPTWLALYDIDDTASFKDESYTVLRKTRSTREVDLIGRLELLDRRLCELLADSGESAVTSSLGTEKPTHHLCTHGLEVPADEVGSWAERSFEALGAGVDGWVRTRVFKCLENLTVGTAADEKAQRVPPYFVVHEFMFPAVALNRTFREVVDKPFVDEVREWVLYRAYPSIVQGNVKAAE